MCDWHNKSLCQRLDLQWPQRSISHRFHITDLINHYVKIHVCEVKHILCGECPQHLRQQELWLILVSVNRFNIDNEKLLLIINCMLIKINWRICTTHLWISILKNKRRTTFCHIGPFEVLHSLILYIYNHLLPLVQIHYKQSKTNYMFITFHW